MLFKLFHMFVFISSCNISFLKLDCSVPELQQLPVGQVRKHSDSGLEVKLKLIKCFLAVTHLNTKTAMGKKSCWFSWEGYQYLCCHLQKSVACCNVVICFTVFAFFVDFILGLFPLNKELRATFKRNTVHLTSRKMITGNREDKPNWLRVEFCVLNLK